ncbi:MAG TPA: BTAD domain-containing putative transcriptional regulator [Streptosporangiaceae bacterium]|nr:BTAD domain-containing putative transcriptional regulator [Streptosporangiaceae bacterium]
MPRVLLLCLLLAGQPVPARRLAELVWDAAEPDGWQVTLRSHVYHLRRALKSVSSADGPGVLVTERVGTTACYALRIPPESIDVVRFERLVAAGRIALDAADHPAAAALLADALALWRGQPLADVAGRSFAVPEVRRLESLHRFARTARIEADIALGRHREVIGDLEGMLARWPTDDLLRRLLVGCLCRAGRYSDAARACRDGIELALAHGLDVTSLEALQRDVLLAALPSAPV